jgi:hypothetical protein
MPKTLKIIIVTISVLATILAIYIAPKVIPYTPPSPNIVKTDQGSFELKFVNNDKFTFANYQDYEKSARDYYSRVKPFIKDPNLIIKTEIFNPGDGLLVHSVNFLTYSDSKAIFYATYIFNTNGSLFSNRYNFKSFIDNSNINNPKSISLQELLQKTEYQSYK